MLKRVAPAPLDLQSGRAPKIFHFSFFEFPSTRILKIGKQIYQQYFNDNDNRFFIVESYHPLRFPKRYLNAEGQLLEYAPFYERDIQALVLKEHFKEEGEFEVKIKRGDIVFLYFYGNYPFDACG